MGKETNTVISNVVKKLLDISAQDSSVEFHQSDFQDETDSAILVRERAKGSKLEPTFAKKTGKIVNETGHTLSTLPESSHLNHHMKTFSKRDIASASGIQTEKVKKAPKRKRAIVSDSTSSSKSEMPKKNAPKKKGEKRQIAELAFDLETESRPQIIKISSGTTGSKKDQPQVSNQRQGQTKEKGNEQFPKAEPNPEKNTKIGNNPNKAATRILERKRCPTKRYGIDIMNVEANDEENETAEA